MKAGIMSMQRVQNYGSFLQAYGLKKTLESMGCEVEFVDYFVEPPLSIGEESKKRNGFLEKVIRGISMLSPEYRQWREKQIQMNQTFAEFSRTYDKKFLPILDVSETRNYSPELDILVIGSDEVFNCTQSGTAVGYSRQLFGKDNRAKKLVSYAAAFGNTTMEKLQHFGVADEVSELLNEFFDISVRDEHSARIIHQLCKIDPKQHIDPVLLYEFPEVDEISIDMKDYVVVYAYADRLNKEEIRAVRQLAAKNNKKILSLGFYQPFCDEFILADPFEVLAYIKHADFVVTDTFHGTVFSIKYGKPFATIVRDSNRQKLTGLLDVFGLTNRSVTDLNLLDDIIHKEIPADVAVRLLKEQQTAKGYLEQVINN